jgi:beta-glucosidase
MKSIERCVNDLMAELTLDEKLAQIGSCWMFDLESKGALDWDKVTRTLRHGLGQISRVAGASKLDPVGAAIQLSDAVGRKLRTMIRLAYNFDPGSRTAMDALYAE